MKGFKTICLLGSAGLIAMSSVAMTSGPASAQVGDFLCSTLSIGCPPPPPPPPPVVAEPAPAEAPVKKVRKRKKVKKAAKAAPADTQ